MGNPACIARYPAAAMLQKVRPPAGPARKEIASKIPPQITAQKYTRQISPARDRIPLTLHPNLTMHVFTAACIRSVKGSMDENGGRKSRQLPAAPTAAPNAHLRRGVRRLRILFTMRRII